MQQSLELQVSLVQERTEILQRNAPRAESVAAGGTAGLEFRLRNRDALYLMKLDQALVKFKAGGYGLCEGCGESIDSRRLMVRPATSHCVSCKEGEEVAELKTIHGRRPKSWVES